MSLFEQSVDTDKLKKDEEEVVKDIFKNIDIDNDFYSKYLYNESTYLKRKNSHKWRNF